MMKKLVIVLGIAFLLMTGCGGDGDDGLPWDKNGDEATKAATVVVDEDDGDGDTQPTAEATEEEDDSGDGAKGAIESLRSLGGPLLSGGTLDLTSANAPVDPALTAALLEQSDLPGGFMGLGQDLTFAADSPEGKMEAALRVFMEGDMTSGEVGSVLVSAAMSIPPASMEEFDSALEELKGEELTAEDLQEMVGELGGEGVQFKEFKLIETPDLGKKSFGMHIVLDAGEMAAGDVEGMEAFQNGIAFDMFVFVKGERGYMLMNMWPAGTESSADGLALAEEMLSRAQ